MFSVCLMLLHSLVIMCVWVCLWLHEKLRKSENLQLHIWASLLLLLLLLLLLVLLLLLLPPPLPLPPPPPQSWLPPQTPPPQLLLSSSSSSPSVLLLGVLMLSFFVEWWWWYFCCNDYHCYYSSWLSFGRLAYLISAVIGVAMTLLLFHQKCVSVKKCVLG